MAFGQQQGRPASAKQVQYLLALLQAAGHEGFRDARGPMGFTQRQAGGKFTIDEASAFIDQLTGDSGEAEVAPVAAPPGGCSPSWSTSTRRASSPGGASRTPTSTVGTPCRTSSRRSWPDAS